MQIMPPDFPTELAQALDASTPLGRDLVASIFESVRLPGCSGPSEPYAEWRRLFGQVVGIRSERLHRALQRRMAAGEPDYGADLPAYLYALHSAFALVVRISAVATLPEGAATLTDRRLSAAKRLGWLASEAPFTAVGIQGMGDTGRFGWVSAHASGDDSTLTPTVLATIQRVVELVSATGLGQLGAPWVGDLFTRLYQMLVPRELRHALGEVYTPPALAAYALDRIGWHPGCDLLDPTCGTGTFLLEALRRRIMDAPPDIPADILIAGLWGVDLNPLAVLAAKASLVVALAPFIDPTHSLHLPVFRGDALDDTIPLPIPSVSHVCGNPPWVKVSQLPPEYSAKIRPVCARLALFGNDRYVGGVEVDFSAAVSYAALARWGRPGTRAALYLTASLFTTPSCQGFRRFTLPPPLGPYRVLAVEDFKATAPFEGVSNHPALLLLEVGAPTGYPVPYRVHDPLTGVRELTARPWPGKVDGPWLRGTATQQAVWARLFKDGAPGYYHARKGVTTDRNGIYFVTVTKGDVPGFVSVTNNPGLGRKPDVPPVSLTIETDHLFPLLRGRGLMPFRTKPETALHVIIPQRGMHGDAALPVNCSQTFRYFQFFETELRARASYRRYQQGKPFWSTWSTGSYTFSPWKVLWREISNRFYAAAQGPVDDPLLGARVVVPDHKLYFIPVADEAEAAFLTGLLNAPTVATAVTAGAAALSLGGEVIDRLRLPRFDDKMTCHRELAALAREGRGEELDRVALSVLKER